MIAHRYPYAQLDPRAVRAGMRILHARMDGLTPMSSAQPELVTFVLRSDERGVAVETEAHDAWGHARVGHYGWRTDLWPHVRALVVIEEEGQS